MIVIKVNIRKYQPKDRENLRKICKKTASAPFTNSENLLNAVPIVYSDYFTKYESDNIFVSVNENDEAVGYILCSSDTKLFKKKMRTEVMRQSVKSHPFMFFVIIGYLFVLTINGHKVEPHLHIDISEDYQHLGLGRMMIDALRDHLYSKGFQTLYVNSISTDADAYGFYIKYGFKSKPIFSKKFVSLYIPTKRV